MYVEIMPDTNVPSTAQWLQGKGRGMSLLLATFLLLLLALQEDITDPGCSQWVTVRHKKFFSHPAVSVWLTDLKFCKNQDKTLYCTQRGGGRRRGEISPLLGGGGGEGGGLLQVFLQK